MFSADVFFAKHDFLPKNGPVPIQAVNAYAPDGQLAGRGSCYASTGGICVTSALLIGFKMRITRRL